jgi:hypothetical protein
LFDPLNVACYFYFFGVHILFLILSLFYFFGLHRLGDALSSLSAKKEPVLSGNSRITQILSDSLGNFLSVRFQLSALAY